jgi:hypothetical protein
MDEATVTLRDICFQYKDNYKGQLFNAIDKTNTGGTYRFLLHESKMETVDKVLNNLDTTLDAFGAWDDCDVHLRYLTAVPISLVGRVVKSTPTSFWENYLSAFRVNDNPSEIDTQELQYSTKKWAPWVRASYSDIAKGCNAESKSTPMVANMSAQGQDVNSTDSGIQDGSNQSDHSVSQQGTISGTSNLKRKMEEINRERTALKREQLKLKERISTVTCSMTKLREDILGIRRGMKQMSTSLRSEIAEFKNLILNMSANKKGRSKKKQKKLEVASTFSVEQGREKYMEVYDEIVHDRERHGTVRNKLRCR